MKRKEIVLLREGRGNDSIMFSLFKGILLILKKEGFHPTRGRFGEKQMV